MPDVHVVRVMDRVVLVIERIGPDCELAAFTAQAAPSQVVTLDGGIELWEPEGETPSGYPTLLLL